jgi:hypothetical protein
MALMAKDLHTAAELARCWRQRCGGSLVGGRTEFYRYLAAASGSQ